MTVEPDRPAPFVANIIAPALGRCFRYVVDDGLEGYPKRCPELVAWSGIVVDPNGKRVKVEACSVHADALVEQRRMRPGRS